MQRYLEQLHALAAPLGVAPTVPDANSTQKNNGIVF